jgi:hypothetical protein
MRFNKFVLTGLTTLACLGLAPKAMANGRNPGSLLLFPEFDNRSTHLTLVTVTNTNNGVDPNNPAFTGTIEAHFIYVGRRGLGDTILPCLETDRSEILTANDTISLLTSVHNPQQEQGFLYVYAQDPITHKAISFNWLIGNLLTLESITSLEYSMNPVAFKAIPPQGSSTADVDGDSVRDLDGAEYEMVTDEILIPRFVGISADYRSELILIGLSGGAAFDTIADFWIYNDLEQPFSAQYQFRCWDRVRLDLINGAFTQLFLKSTLNAPNEVIGAPSVETGWMRIHGSAAFSTSEQINDPAIYAVLIEKIGAFGAADLPFESGLLRDGDLFPHGPFGDPKNGQNPGTETHDNQ